MPRCQGLAEENERRLETASCRDPPSNNYRNELLERSLATQQQQQSGGRKKTGGIMYRSDHENWVVEIRPPKWTDYKFWICCEDFEAAQWNADAALYLAGKLPFHFPNANLSYLPLRLSTGEELTTREKCSAYVAKIAKDSALCDQRKDYKERAQELIREMVKRPEVVQLLNTRRASPRQAWQPRPEVNSEDTGSPFTEGENGTAMEVGGPSEEAIEASASTVPVNPSQCGNLVLVAEENRSVIADDGGEENLTPVEVDSASEEAIQALAPSGTVDPAAVSQVHSTMNVDMSTAFIPGFEMDLYDSKNVLTSAGQSLGVWHHRFAQKEKEDLVPDNLKELMASLDRDEEEIWKSTEQSDWELWSPHPPFVPHSPLLAPTLPGSG